MRERLDLKIAEDKQKKEMVQMKDLNDQLLKQVDDLQKKLQSTDPEVLKDQKELIADLNNKVAVLERELQLVHDNFEHEIEKYKINGGGQRRKPGDDLDELTQQKIKQELVKCRGELDESTKQISGLQQELQAQAKYYEMELRKAQQSHKMAALGSDRDTLDVANLQARSRQLEERLLAALTERDQNLIEISKLQNELKRQEAHYTQEL